MNERSIVFLLANPVPEIWPWEAKDAGAEIIATGRSDFPNQVNNSLLFPAIFRGTLDIRSRAITDEIIITGAEELARCARETNLHKEHIIPTMEEWEVYPKVAAKVGERGVELGLARKSLSKNEIYERAKKTISRSRRLLNVLVENRLIKNL